jgi:ComF family protein
MRLFEQLLGIIAPHECAVCTCEGTLLCIDCAHNLPQAVLERPLRGVVNVWPGVMYAGHAKAVVHAVKFERAAAGAQDMARAIASRLPHDIPWIVTHIPTATVRVRQRGYDQSRLVAQRVARYIGASYVPLLARQSAVRQVGAPRALRLQQMSAAFRPMHALRIQKQHILLIDDVLTTGSTIESAAAALLIAGAAQVSAATFAAAGFTTTSKKHAKLL